MKAENTMRLLDVWVGVRDPRQAKKVEHQLVELLVVAVCAVLSGADTFVAVEVWKWDRNPGVVQILCMGLRGGRNFSQ